jgi:hypothetical protein
MLLTRRLLLALTLACAGIAPASAALIIDVVLTPTELRGDPPFGIGALAAGPFTARFTLDDALPANFAGALDVDAFAATIGDQSWELDDLRVIDVDGLVGQLVVHTDATGTITQLVALAIEGQDLVTIGFGAGAPVDWEATEVICLEEFGCVLGTASVSARLVDAIPEPAPLLLVTVALAAIAATRRDLSAY